MIFLSWMSGKLCVYIKLWKEMYKSLGGGFYSAEMREREERLERVWVFVREVMEVLSWVCDFDLTRMWVELGSYKSILLVALGENACKVLVVITRVKEGEWSVMPLDPILHQNACKGTSVNL